MPHPILPIRTTPSPDVTEHPSAFAKDHAKSKTNGYQYQPSSLNGESRLESRHGTMKAVMWEGRTGHVAVHHVPKPQIRKDSELLIRITTAASKCHIVSSWDLHR